MVTFLRNLLNENDLEVVLDNFCCYDYDANASEAFQKIAIDQKDFQKCSSCVIVCWMAKIYQSVIVRKAWLLGHLRHSWESCRSCTEKGVIIGPWCFILNGSEIIIWLGYSFKTKSTKSKATFLRKELLFWISRSKLQIIRLAQRHWSCTPTN